MSADRRFRARWVPSLAAALGVALTLAAGAWQMGRADEKARLQEVLDARRKEPPVAIAPSPLGEDDLMYRRVRVEGRFAPEHTVYIDNRLRRHVPGFEIITPMRIGDSERFVAVNRGWIAGGARRDALPAVTTPPGPLTLEGTVVPAQRVLQLEHSGAKDKVWLSFSVDRMREESGIDLQDALVQQESPLDDGLERVWDRPDSGREKHLAYAFQWFALAFAILVLYVVLGFRPALNTHGQA
jgi:surfeit locus 1 family protein